MHEKNVMVLLIVLINVKRCIVEMELEIIENNVILKIKQIKHDGDQIDVINFAPSSISLFKSANDIPVFIFPIFSLSAI